MGQIFFRLRPPQNYRPPTRWAEIPAAEATNIREGVLYIRRHIEVLRRIGEAEALTIWEVGCKVPPHDTVQVREIGWLERTEPLPPEESLH